MSFDPARPGILLTVPELASILSCPKMAAYRLVATRQFGHYEIERNIRVAAAEVRAWLDSSASRPWLKRRLAVEGR